MPAGWPAGQMPGAPGGEQGEHEAEAQAEAEALAAAEAEADAEAEAEAAPMTLAVRGVAGPLTVAPPPAPLSAPLAFSGTVLVPRPDRSARKPLTTNSQTLI